MRTLLRFLLLWAIILPLFYFAGLPFLLEKLSEKMRADNTAACYTHLKNQGLFDTPTAIINKDEAARYCHCVTDGLTLTTADLPTLMQHQTPQHLTTGMQPVIDACNATLQEAINGTLNSAPQPRVTHAPDGTETMHFDPPVHIKEAP